MQRITACILAASFAVAIDLNAQGRGRGYNPPAPGVSAWTDANQVETDGGLNFSDYPHQSNTLPFGGANANNNENWQWGIDTSPRIPTFTPPTAPSPPTFTPSTPPTAASLEDVDWSAFVNNAIQNAIQNAITDNWNA